MARAEIKEVLAVSKDSLWKAITRYEDYPQFVESCSRVQVDRSQPSKVVATYWVSMIKDISYRLQHSESPETGRVEWSLQESEFMKSNRGSWTLKSLGPEKTEVLYEVEIEFKIPVPSLVLNGLVKKSLPSMLRSFEKRALHVARSEH